MLNSYSVECNLDESSDMYLTPTTTSCRSSLVGCFVYILIDFDVKPRRHLASDVMMVYLYKRGFDKGVNLLAYRAQEQEQMLLLTLAR